jgi:hypothetical protein
MAVLLGSKEQQEAMQVAEAEVLVRQAEMLQMALVELVELEFKFLQLSKIQYHNQDQLVVV